MQLALRAKLGVVNLLSRAGWETVHRGGHTYQIRPRVRLGADPFADIRRITRQPILSVYDVGANIGQTAEQFVHEFPDATIHSFEPDPDTFRTLAATASQLPRVTPHHCALGRSEGSGTLHRFGYNETNSLLPKATGAESFVADASYYDERGTATVDVATVDSFSQAQGIDRIDLLKIDTQGYELEVLWGAERMLASGGIPFVYAEVCFIRYYEGQPLFQEVYTHLYERGYRLVGLYESGFLTHYYHVGGNALFVHESLGARTDPAHSLRLGPVTVSW